MVLRSRDVPIPCHRKEIDPPSTGCESLWVTIFRLGKLCATRLQTKGVREALEPGCTCGKLLGPCTHRAPRVVCSSSGGNDDEPAPNRVDSNGGRWRRTSKRGSQ